MKRTFILLFFLSFVANLFGQQSHPIFIHPLIKEYFTVHDTLSCILVLQDQAGTIPIASNASKEEKSTQVYKDLSTLAELTQKPLLDSLDKWKIRYHSFYIINAIQVKLDSTTLKKISKRPDLFSILPDFPLTSLEEPVTSGNIRSKDTLINWAISHIHADEVWEMGITGKGVVVAGLDTGTEWDNVFLLQNYRGKSQNGQIDHDYNWYDGIRKIDLPNGDSTTNSPNNPCDFSSPTSCDDNGHGTYTMGLMTGNFENQFTGIAPGTQWISARVMKKGDGRLSTYLRGLEWCLAPTDVNGNNPRPELAPDIINNSWDCPRREGCIPENYWILDSAAVRLNQAGILTVASAGNNGRQGCQSLTTPLALFSSIFTVGAIDRNDSITDFSSRGPIDSSSDIKPDVVAPGKGITSIYPGGKFQTSSGTSSSAPITAGVAALILEANPALKGQPDLLRNILIKSALPINENSCGESTSPNPVYGYGRIDAMKAIQLAKEFHPTSSRPALPENSFSLYPNPFRNEVHLKSHVTSSARINIYDIRGQLTTSFTLAGHEEIELVLSDLQIGLHFAQIITSKGILLRKLIKI